MYKRRNLLPSPPSLLSMEVEDDNDYLLDPYQMHDTLPQPYRMINKILTQLIDSVWDIVETKENALLADARKIRPPQFNEPHKLNLYPKATALGSSADSKYIFVGLPNGLAVLDASTQSSLHIWEQNRAEITGIKSYQIGPLYHLIITQDDMEQIRLFLFVHDTLFLIKAMNENPPESSSKTLCQKWEASSGGHFAGFVYEQTSNNEVWLEVYSLPVDSWVKDLDNFMAASKDLYVDPAENNIDTRPNEKPAIDGNIDTARSDKVNIKFSNPVSIVKIKPPPGLSLPANTSSNIASAVHKVDNGDVLGMGLNHVLGTTCMDSMDAMFQYRHEKMMEYLPADKENQAVSATFHFVNASRMNTLSHDQDISDTTPVTVIVWWSDSPHLCFYSLSKSGKVETSDLDEPTTVDIESKLDIVWPFTSNIICSSVSPCMSYLAVGLTNGNIVLWNRQLGLHKAVLNASHTSYIKSLRFLDPCLFPYDSPQYPPYPIKSATFLLVECSDGTQKLFDTCNGSQQIPRCIVQEPPETDDEVQTLLQLIPNLPKLIVYVQKNGNMYIKDIGTGATLCQFALPSTHQIQTPWNPVFAFGNEGKILYLKGEGSEVDDAGTVTDISGIFMFDLCSYPALDIYRSRKHEKKQLSVYTTQEQRISALMQARIQQQIVRKSRLQERWGQLKSELDIIQQARKVPVNSTKLLINLKGC